MKASRVGIRSWWERMKILEVVMGSNQRLIQPQTVGKKAGAPIIYFSISTSSTMKFKRGVERLTKIRSKVSG